MDKQYDLINIEGGWVAVDKEATKGIKGQWVVETHNSILTTVCELSGDWDLNRGGYQDKLIIAHTGIPSLKDSGLPLFQMIDYASKLAVDETNSDEEKYIKKWNSKQFVDNSLKQHCSEIKNEEVLLKRIYLNRSMDFQRGFTKGYKAAGGYTEEDVRKAIDMAQLEEKLLAGTVSKYTPDEIIQSLKKHPVAIVVACEDWRGDSEDPVIGNDAKHLIIPKVVNNHLTVKEVLWNQ